MGKRVFAAFAALVVMTAALGAGGKPEAPRLETVRLTIGYIPHVQFAPLYVGMAKGFYREEGIDLVLSFGFQYDIFSLLEAGKIDLGLSDSDQLILAGARDMGLQAVYQYYQKYPVAIVARADRVREPSDLKGKIIGTPELSGTSYIGLQLFLRKYGLEGAARVEKIGYTQEVSLETGKVDAAVCFSNNEPIVLRQKGLAIRQWEVRDFSDMVGASFISSRAVISARGDVLRRFVRATRKAMAFTVDRRDESFGIALTAVGDVKKEDEPLFRMRLDATCELFGHPKGYGYLDADRYARSIQELAGFGLISGSYPADRILKQF